MNTPTCGHIVGMRLRPMLEDLVEVLPEQSIFCIRSIDSCTSSESISKILNRYDVSFASHTNNIELDKKAIIQALKKNMFTGFDEVWILKHPWNQDLELLPRSTSDSENFSVSLPNEILAIARQDQCIGIVADGDGLNYYTKDQCMKLIINKYTCSLLT